MDWNEVTYQDEVDELVDENSRTLESIVVILLLLKQKQMMGKFSQNEANLSLRKIDRLMKSLQEYNRKWIEKNVPFAGKDGVYLALSSLGLTDKPKSFDDIFRFRKTTVSKSQQAEFLLFIERLDNDLLGVTNQMNRRARQAVREIIAENFREQTIKKKITKEALINSSVGELSTRFGDTVNHAITDSMGRKWKLKDYVTTLVNTTLMEVTNQATINESLRHGITLGQISTVSTSKDACVFHQGSIVRLDDSVNAPFPSVRELQLSGQIFHPNCKHRIVPIDLADVSDDELSHIQNKNDTSSLALATGKRNVNSIRKLIGE